MLKNNFWHKGLQFQCHRCGNCCTFPGGAVYASKGEFRKIAKHLGISFEQFLEQYTEEIDGYVSLKSVPEGPCIFYDHGCSIYEVRPIQCRTFPFWDDLLKSQTRWSEQAKTCQGIDKGRVWSKKEIKEQLKAKKENLLKAEGKKKIDDALR